MPLQHYLLPVEHLFKIQAGIEVDLVFRVLFRMCLDVLIPNLVSYLLTRVIDLWVIDHSYRRLSFGDPYIAMYLGRHVIAIGLGHVTRHIVENDEAMFRRLESGKQDIGVPIVSLRDLVICRHFKVKAATFLPVEQRCEDGGRVEIGQAEPVDAPRFGYQCRGTAVADDSVVKILHR